jgi:hypothetical protein
VCVRLLALGLSMWGSVCGVAYGVCALIFGSVCASDACGRLQGSRMCERVYMGSVCVCAYMGVVCAHAYMGSVCAVAYSRLGGRGCLHGSRACGRTYMGSVCGHAYIGIGAYGCFNSVWCMRALTSGLVRVGDAYGTLHLARVFGFVHGFGVCARLH